MEQISKFVELLDRKISLAQTKQIRYAVCGDVDKDAKTMTAYDENNVPYFNVKLGLGNICLYPEKDSACLIGIIDNDDTDTFLVAAEKVDKIQVANENEDLKELLKEIIKEISSIVVVQGTSPNLPALEKLTERINTLFK